MPLLRRPRSALVTATAALLLFLLAENSTAFLFGRTKAGARAVAPLRRPPHSAAAAAAAAAPAKPSKGVLGRLLDRISPLGIKDYGYVVLWVLLYRG